MSGDQLRFGRFRVDLGRRELWRDENLIHLGNRALDVLCALVSAKGEVVTKDELMAQVWSGLAVEESNIHVHISALRKALDEGTDAQGYVVTAPGRGYRFIGLQPQPPADKGEGDTRQGLLLPDRPSIAVLPFANLSGDAEQEYFADGIVEEIITALSRMRWLFVIARNSSFTYKGRAVDVKQVGRELGVRYVLEGSVRKAANRVRITAQLIDSLTGAHLWARPVPAGVSDRAAYLAGLTEFVFGKVKFVITAVPRQTDLNKLFEVINSRGVQLQHHEILKARMLDALTEEERGPYAVLWEACADMENFIERNLSGISVLSASEDATVAGRGICNGP